MKRILVSFCISLFSVFSLYATGPSSIELNMVPIALTGKGEIFCRTRCYSNEMGSYSSMKVSYGYSIIGNNKIIELPYKIFQLNASGEGKEEDSDVFFDELARWDSLYATGYGSIKTDLEVIKLLKDEYEFTNFHLEKYKVGKAFTWSELEKLKKRKHLDKIPQKALRAPKEVSYMEYMKKQYLDYDFGNILLFRNIDSSVCAELEVYLESVDAEPEDIDLYECYGAHFFYINPIFGDQEVGYENINITGVMFL